MSGERVRGRGQPSRPVASRMRLQCMTSPSCIASRKSRIDVCCRSCACAHGSSASFPRYPRFWSTSALVQGVLLYERVPYPLCTIEGWGLIFFFGWGVRGAIVAQPVTSRCRFSSCECLKEAVCWEFSIVLRDGLVWCEKPWRC